MIIFRNIASGEPKRFVRDIHKNRKRMAGKDKDGFYGSHTKRWYWKRRRSWSRKRVSIFGRFID